MKKVLMSLILGLGVLLAGAGMKNVQASEGTFELKNRVGEDARCFATSVLMQDLKYEILVSCRDIIYPGGTEVFSYVAWTNPVDGGGAQKLGTLGLGKVQFSTKKAFGSIYITKESDAKTRSPSGPVVMSGNLQKITLLESPSMVDEGKSELGEPELSPSPIAKKSSALNIFRTGGILAFVGLVGVVILVLFITRQ